MMSTVGLELINLINPDLTWKTVAKGSRSASRRSRKLISSNFTMESNPPDEGSRKVDETTVSDTEKHGVAVLGGRFSENIDQVPIKKRRFALPVSPQSPRSTSPTIDVQSSDSNGKRRRKVTNASSTSKFSQKISGVSDCKFDRSDDFSGIEILASVACNNNIFNDVDHNGGNSLIEEPVQAVGTSASVSPDVLVNKDKIEASSLQDSTVTVSENCPSIKDTTVTISENCTDAKDSTRMEGSSSSRCGRLPFDLNVPWEQPFDTLSVDSGENAVQSSERHGQEGFKYDSANNVSSDVSADHHLSCNFNGIGVGTYGSNEEPKIAGSGRDGSSDENVPSSHGVVQENLTSDTIDRKASSHIVAIDSCLDHLTCPAFSKENLDVSLSSSGSVLALDVQLGKIMCGASVQVQRCNVSSPNLKHSGDNDYHRSSGLLEDGKSIQDGFAFASCQQIAPISVKVEPGSQAEPIQDGISLANSQQIAPMSLKVEPGNRLEELGGHQGVPTAGCQPLVADDVKGQSTGTSGINSTENDSSSYSGTVGLTQKSLADSTVTTKEASNVHGNGDADSLAKVAMEDPSDESFESDVYQAEKVTKNAAETQAGYDSQFEDGELRESDAPYFWDENGEDGEVEHVDYGSDWEDERHSGLDNEQEVKVERGSSQACDNGSRKIEHAGAGDAPRDDFSSARTRTSDLLDSEGFPSELFCSRASNREILSRFEGSNAVYRNDNTVRNRGNYNYNLYCREGRDTGPKNFMRRDRPASHLRGRSPEGRRFVDPSAVCWGPERRYSPTYRGPYNSGLPRPKSGVEDRGYAFSSDHTDPEVLGFTGVENRPRRQFINSSSNAVNERINRRRSPGNRGNEYNTPTGMLPVRDNSPMRGRLRRFAPGTGRGTREQYHGPLSEDTSDYSNRFAQRLTRRERSVSPINRGRPPYALTYRKSRSRSRSRSPISYLPPRERNEGSRLRSRSPDFRSDTRMDRGRLPFQKRVPAEFDEEFVSQNRRRFQPQRHFPAEFDEEFVPQNRRRFQPQRHSRWHNDRNGASDSFRGRKSPTAVIRQNQRFGSVRSGHRLNSDDQFRPYMQSRKFLETGGGGRGVGYEGSDDDRRQRGNRFEMVHRVRRYDTDGAVRRFRYNEEDSFVAPDS